jgi:hypothetical protein
MVRLFPFLLLLFLILSCAKKVLIPVGNGVEVDPDKGVAIYRDEWVRIKVKANAWDGYPSSLPDRLLPLYMEIENLSDEKVVIRREEILLIDDRGNQYNALDPKEAAEVVRGSSRIGVSFGFAVGTPSYGLGWLAGAPYTTDVEDVINKAFIPGTLLPGAKLKGFLYFQRLPDEVNRTTLRVGYKIGGQLRVAEFHFKVSDGKGGADNGNKEGGKRDSPETS